jgi:signal recognition particle receptor subunit alpha
LFDRFTGKIKSLTGNMELTEQELEPVLIEFKDALMTKNVAEEIAQKIVDSMRVRLTNTRTSAFTSVSRTVQECLRETLEKVLTPKRHIDIISEAMRSREKGKPYVIVFVGVNGVGKSTTLAKVAYLFKNQDFSVMIAACDNFRAGAVE